jgi:hypothetical protein
MFETILASLPALFNVGTLLFLLLFVYSILGVSLFHNACMVPPPGTLVDISLVDPCSNPEQLGFAGFVARNITEAVETYASGIEPTAGWGQICIPSTLECGDFHHVWRCVSPYFCVACRLTL